MTPTYVEKSQSYGKMLDFAASHNQDRAGLSDGRSGSPSLGNIRLIRVRGEQLSKSVTSCAQLRVRRQPERQADRVGRMPWRDGESI